MLEVLSLLSFLQISLPISRKLHSAIYQTVVVEPNSPPVTDIKLGGLGGVMATVFPGVHNVGVQGNVQTEYITWHPGVSGGEHHLVPGDREIPKLLPHVLYTITVTHTGELFCIQCRPCAVLGTLAMARRRTKRRPVRNFMDVLRKGLKRREMD